ncbi:hypothetical protein ACNJ7K_11570 [Rhodococcus aetherivorans]
MILYLHGANGGYNQFTSLSAWIGLREWLIDNGWGWIEGGGAQPWGNAASRTAYRAAFDHVDGILDIGPVVILTRPMGGLVGHWLFTQDPVLKDRSVGFIGNSEVANLAAAYATSRWTADMHAAYGTDAAGFAAASVGHDPMLFSPSLWAGKKVLELVGTNDTTVRAADHGLAIRAHWEEQPAVNLLDTRESGDHPGTNGSYLQVEAMSQFLSLFHGQADDPDPGRAQRRVTSRRIIAPSGIHALTGAPRVRSRRVEGVAAHARHRAPSALVVHGLRAFGGLLFDAEDVADQRRSGGADGSVSAVGTSEGHARYVGLDYSALTHLPVITRRFTRSDGAVTL